MERAAHLRLGIIVPVEPLRVARVMRGGRGERSKAGFLRERPSQTRQAVRFVSYVARERRGSAPGFWRRCMGVEPTPDRACGQATVLKTARPTGTLPPPERVNQR